MEYTRPLGLLVVLGIVLSLVGALLSLVTGPLAGAHATAAIATIAVVVVGVVAMVAVGTHGSAEWLENSGYW